MNYFKIIAIGIIVLFSNTIKAQVSVNINIGSPPEWGPIGYTEARYYYLPDVEAYYDIQSSTFIYFGDGVWLHRTYLPVIYRNYDLYSGYKVVMVDYHGETPYSYFKEHKVKYKKGYRGPAQKTIGEKPGKNKSNSKKSSPSQTKKQKNNNPSSGEKKSGKQINSGKKGKKK